MPYVRHWKERLIPWMIQDERISDYVSKDFSDTPIPMTRNASVLWARSVGADYLIMVDSDMFPDRYLGPGSAAKPFLESSFDYAYKLWETKMLCILSPYVGPPPEEPPYTFEWRALEGKDSMFKLEMMTREYAARLGGFHEIAAGPTGLIMTDMRLFDLTDPKKVTAKLEELGRDVRLEHKGWFYYEYPDEYGAEKASTEDVTFTRELSQVGLTALGYNPVIGNFDAWSGHMKPKICGKPLLVGPEHINDRLVTAVLTGPPKDKKLHKLDFVKADMDFSGAEVVDQDGQSPAPTEKPFRKDPRRQIPPEIQIRRVCGVEVKSLGFQSSLHDLQTLGQVFHAVVDDYTRSSMATMLAVEIGSWVGESTIALAQCGGQVRNSRFKLWAVDPHAPFNDGATFDLYGAMPEGLVERTFRENTNGFAAICYKKMTSEEASKLEPNKKVKFLFVDGAHDRDGLERDITAWLPRLHSEATLVFHDYKFPGYPDVTTVLHEFFGESQVYNPPGTTLAVVDWAKFQKAQKKMAKDCGPAKGAKSPPKGGPMQKKSAPKGGPLKKGK